MSGEQPDTARRQAAAAVIREHADHVFRTLQFLGVRPADLDDASQEVFIVVLRKLESFEQRSTLKTWLRGICVKTAAAYRRRAHVRREVPVAMHDEEPAPGSPEQDVANRQRLALIHRALDLLDEDKRTVFVLYEIEGLTMQETADAAGCPLQTAYSRYHAAREQVAGYARRASLQTGGPPARPQMNEEASA